MTGLLGLLLLGFPPGLFPQLWPLSMYCFLFRIDRDIFNTLCQHHVSKASVFHPSAFVTIQLRTMPHSIQVFLSVRVFLKKRPLGLRYLTVYLFYYEENLGCIFDRVGTYMLCNC